MDLHFGIRIALRKEAALLTICAGRPPDDRHCCHIVLVHLELPGDGVLALERRTRIHKGTSQGGQ